MKILLDECVPTIVKRGLPDRDIVTVKKVAWAGIKNGDLLRLAEKSFDVFITSDKNVPYQQNLRAFDVSFIVANQRDPAA